MHARPTAFYAVALLGIVSAIIGFVLWLDDATLALVASLAFAGLLVWWARNLTREWRESDAVERIILALGVLLLLGASAANVVRYFLLSA